MANFVSWDHHGCFITYTDRVTFSEFMDAIFAIHANENYDRLIFVIHDMTRVTELDFTDVDMTKIVAHELGARFTNPNVRPAVVSSDQKMGAMTNIFSEMTRLDVGFFPTIAEAMVWANRTPLPV